MKYIYRILFICVLSISGFVLFQAQDFQNPFDDSNPFIDRPTRESMSHFSPPNPIPQPLLITDAQGFDNFDISIDNYEQQLVSHPTNPQWLFFGVNGSPQNAWNSTNGGINWTLVQPSYPGGTCCDPWSVYLSNGTLVYGSGVSGQNVYRSTNNGNTWTSPVLSVSGSDRNTLGAELTGTGPFANYVYASITGSGGAPFARSTDLGATWTTTGIRTPHNLPGVMIAVGPNGSTNGGSVILVTSTQPTNNPTYTFHRSTDGGSTFTTMSSLTVAGIVGFFNSVSRHTINNGRTRPYPWIAYDNSDGPFRGRLYLVYASNDPAGNGNKPDIKLQYSTNHGANWSASVRVNDDANPQLSDQWSPTIWCEPVTGKLYISWYDDRSNPATFQTDRYATYSTTGGVSFAPNQRITNASWTFPCPSCSPNTNCYRGDYEGITSNTKAGFLVWSDHRNCNARTMGGYFPDYALRVQPDTVTMTGVSDSQFVFTAIPAVKLFNDTVLFSASISPSPSNGSFNITFIDKNDNRINRNFLTAYPDSVRCRIKTSGGVTTGVYTLTINSNGLNGTPIHVRTVTVFVDPLGVVSNNNEIPESFRLFQNFPNPFNPKTNIRFDIANAGPVKLTVFDVTGKEITQLVNGTYSPGKYMVDFDAANYSSGIYFYRIETGDYVSVKKMMFVK